MTYSIQQISKMVNLSTHTIRYYEKINLIPEVKRNPSGYRIYENEDIERLKLITCLKNVGMSLENIRPFLSIKDNELLSDYPDLMDMALKHKEDMLNQIADLQKVIEIIDSKLEQNSFRHIPSSN
ncbi:MerR family transcriptional regulator [Paenibacillus tundrae]|uniref:DNA-binding transcriptional MerR regulator n=1 Tax=Paenibacillus tundrae TaxID=528187 RepID=A0ABT9WDI2_9BACL|nr:MerR family transcriptional regulator [Paenibacillus tundrae]MDQ0171318.1 DNA-binding transcriptional MerR regulator [Paenibacillus tundrae]